ncbi:MAG: Hsp20/alpha crystallin family protein [Dehalococcoidales bacterium]|nr:Hsp20/alpha crystallin family protein [Dehalococcoidales bacterium]
MQRWRSGKGLIPWRPFRELENIEQHFEDVFDRSWLPAVWRRIPSLEMGWAPAVEVFEKEGKFVVKAELPGIKEEDMDISVVDNTLTIKGEKKTESEVKEEDYYCCECSYGSFSRSIALPSNVDAKKIAASYEDGILEISLPKASEVKPKKISVSSKKKEKASR